MRHQSKDALGRVYEYFLGRFVSAEGKGGGEFLHAPIGGAAAAGGDAGAV